ncbi:MAG: CDP-alcohol phosphatidyltransferase family protein [Pseudomonadota bacterium]|nr:CDP-alcohol phosphatidyltransferase family protein [Pseudomonadota bacterium]
MSHHTWMHRIAHLGVIPLSRTAVTPNQLTTVRLFMGIAAAVLFALGPEWNIHAALVCLAAMLVDRMDGDLARLTGSTTSWGHTYDLIVDGICDALVFVGIGLGLTGSPLGVWAIPMGILAGLSVSLTFLLVLKVERVEGPRAAELGGRAGFDPDDGMLVVPVAGLLGWTEPLLIAASVGAPLFALFMLWKFGRKLRARQARPQVYATPGFRHLHIQNEPHE